MGFGRMLKFTELNNYVQNLFRSSSIETQHHSGVALPVEYPCYWFMESTVLAGCPFTLSKAAGLQAGGWTVRRDQRSTATAKHKASVLTAK